MDLSTWLLFVATEIALCFSPGPAVVYTAAQSLSGGLRSSIAASLGVVSGNVIYFVVSALGLGALLLTSHHFFLFVKWVGVLYLVVLGLRMVFADGGLLTANRGKRRSSYRVFQGGLVLQLASPKNLVFFLAILPPFIDPEGDVVFQILVLGATSQILEFIALMTYGGLADYSARRISTPRIFNWLDRAAGVLIVAVAANLALLSRPSNGGSQQEPGKALEGLFFSN